ncbi:hypothetical protein PCANC_13145 [Puccinia coronata f. sp. avenae]|uniref:Uncharacterized protein n=1 Tax=Puccinia coronata f. sp. avenae TaxID=200324 RepID=A0A2N5UWB8_9BASI|nr:hypothetical protein PCANC_13145 [Puccinia coronata f. sp. avenae]
MNVGVTHIEEASPLAAHLFRALITETLARERCWLTQYLRGLHHVSNLGLREVVTHHVCHPLLQFDITLAYSPITTQHLTTAPPPTFIPSESAPQPQPLPDRPHPPHFIAPYESPP